MPLPPTSSFPAPAGGPALFPVPVPPPAAVEETGPVFLDEDPVTEARQEPASAWQADASRQTGFGGDRDRKVSWGSTSDGQGSADPRLDPRRPAQPRTPASDPKPADPTGGALPGVRQVEPRPGSEPPKDRTVTIRATPPQQAQPEQADGTMTIRALGAQAPQAPASQAPAAQPPAAQASAAPQAAQPPRAPQATQAPLSPQVPAQPQPAETRTPLAQGPGGGAASWAQQVHQLAQPEPAPLPHQQSSQQAQQPVVPWKPPVEDPFLKAARAQAAARPASLGKRLLARLIDTVVLGAVAGAVSLPFVTKALDHIDRKIEEAKQSGETVTVWLLDSTTAVNFGIALGALLVLGVLYEALPTAKWGRTLGKKLCGLDVRDIEALEPPSFGAALRRWLVYSVLGLLVLGVVNVLWCLVDRPWRQCWHDKAARTFVAG